MVFQISKSKQSPFVALATGAVYTHCGIVVEKKDGLLVFEGTSEHCFVDDKGKPIFLKRSFPDLYEAFSALESLEES